MDKNNPFKLIGYIIIALLLGKFIFNDEAIAWLFSGLRPIIVTFVIIYLISPLVELFYQKTKFNRTWSVVSAFLVCFIAVALFISMIVPSIIDSGRIIGQNLNLTNQEFLELVSKIPFISQVIETSSLAAFLDASSQWIIEYSRNLLSYTDRVIGTVTGIIAAFSIGVLSLLMAFYALKDNDKIGSSLEDAINTFIPHKNTKNFLKVLHLVDESFKKFLIGKLYTCFVLGAIVTVMILIFNLVSPWGLKIPYAPLIGFIIGITNIIPYIGPLIGTIPCLFLTILAGFWEVIILLAIVLIAQQIDNIFISPKIIGDSVGLGPFWVVLSVSVGGALFGAIGMVLMVPIVSVLLNLAKEHIEAYKSNTATSD